MSAHAAADPVTVLAWLVLAPIALFALFAALFLISTGGDRGTLGGRLLRRLAGLVLLLILFGVFF